MKEDIYWWIGWIICYPIRLALGVFIVVIFIANSKFLWDWFINPPEKD